MLVFAIGMFFVVSACRTDASQANCSSITVTGFRIGTSSYDSVNGTTVTVTTQSIVGKCSNNFGTAQTIKLYPDLGIHSSGGVAYVSNGSYSIPYTLLNSGSAWTSTNPVTVSLPAGTSGKAGTTTFPLSNVSIRFNSGYAPSTGTYTDNVTFTASGTGGPATALDTGAAYINVGTSCNAPSVTNISIPAYTPLSGSDVTGSFDYSILCTNGSIVTLSINGGLNATTGSCANSTILRQFNNGAGYYLPYCLFQDSLYTTPIDSADTEGITATGSTQTIQIYIDIPGSANVPAGSYSDTIVLTATF